MDFQQIKPHLFQCKKCGAEVPSGVMNIQGHRDICPEREVVLLTGLMSFKTVKRKEIRNGSNPEKTVN